MSELFLFSYGKIYIFYRLILYFLFYFTSAFLFQDDMPNFINVLCIEESI
jgi:hypothetical protein